LGLMMVEHNKLRFQTDRDRFYLCLHVGTNCWP
jgi:hypothetical protein